MLSAFALPATIRRRTRVDAWVLKAEACLGAEKNRRAARLAARALRHQPFDEEAAAMYAVARFRLGRALAPSMQQHMQQAPGPASIMGAAWQVLIEGPDAVAAAHLLQGREILDLLPDLADAVARVLGTGYS